jgi:PPM family protein phosphatase
MGVLAAGITDIGQKRSSNQDSIYLDNDLNLYIVADGMGGHQGGDIASQMVIEVYPKVFKENFEKIKDPDKLLEHCSKVVNEKIFARAQMDSQLQGMGTTLVVLYFHSNKLYINNIGDSRAYLINQKHLFQLTRDHSLVQEKIKMGIYNRENALKDKMKNVLTRAVGFEDFVESDTFEYEVNKSDLFFICSDGLHGKVHEKDILEIITKKYKDVSHLTQEKLDNMTKDLINKANANGGNDNISVIVVAAL